MTRGEDGDAGIPLQSHAACAVGPEESGVARSRAARQLRLSAAPFPRATKSAIVGLLAFATVLLLGSMVELLCRGVARTTRKSSTVQAVQGLAMTKNPPVPSSLLQHLPPRSSLPKSGASVFAFNCSAGYSGWKHEWSVLKKDFCCDKEGKGCEHRSAPPFDCDAGFANWKDGWSVPKMGYCCYHYGKSCEHFGGPADFVTADGISHQTKACSAIGQDCSKSSCCQDPGLQCFRKDNFWAECLETCAPGPNVLDQESASWWKCEAIGDRTPGKRDNGKCSAKGEDCRSTRCCSDPGMQCYEKNELWASCKATCTPGPDLYAKESDPWTCMELGFRTEGVAPWVSQACANQNEDCSKKGCCMDSNHQCFKKDNSYAQCRTECKPGFKANPWDPAWSCEPVGMRTPEMAPSPDSKGVVAPWVAEKCAGEGDNCLDSQCCKSVGWQCYKKNKFWGTCSETCKPGIDPEDNSTLTCEPRGQRSWGLALKGYPSLYCFSVYMPASSERSVMEVQLKRGAGIFACDGYDVFASQESTLGTTKDGEVVKPILFPKIAVGVSQDGTAGNAKLFMAVWDKVIAHKRFRDYDWTIKVDPDAVIIPWRMRDHLRYQVGKNAYVVNCNKFPGSPNFPMMYGAVEVFSMQAMYAYAQGSGRCGSQLPWGAWGEDYYMTHCLDFLGVGRISDFGTLGDQLCTGANCGDPAVAALPPLQVSRLLGGLLERGRSSLKARIGALRSSLVLPGGTQT
eukprot:CAMPEP_0176041134 /NCGR_PEP_ID=MMETSP0120_2-20121206/20401_1 /TAXON_ID=160619 /ORGANISM="Kryptoperidinium foliaceum, Strain CCMP 1326" /LENGTH=738 /DNA_ID=CAMNT_0017374535 /DNA_START=80 /DNA_END=2292 /DNA_ORIENTATION=-